MSLTVGHTIHDPLRACTIEAACPTNRASAETRAAWGNCALTPVSVNAKLLASIADHPRRVRFDDACKAAELLGFIHSGGAGSHRTFLRPGEPVGLNFQNRSGYVVPYQARQLIAMIEKYGETS